MLPRSQVEPQLVNGPDRSDPVLLPEMAAQIAQAIPVRFQFRAWRMVFCLELHGALPDIVCREGYIHGALVTVQYCT